MSLVSLIVAVYSGCHLYGKSVHEIADILKKPKSTVSDVIVKRRGSETADKRTGRPKEFQCLSGISVSSKTIRRELKTWDSMVVKPLTSQTSFHRMRSIDCNGVDLTVIGLWTCENCSLE
ncbi:hypothetical protein TNCV_1795921 [Trichonephila clavipes]|nr:hypothetical protein TNCV_1795921 [Trichonephila clavipes]